MACSVFEDVEMRVKVLDVHVWLVNPLACRYDVDGNGFLDFTELKLMMEKLGEPQTHIALKEMIKTVDEDNDGSISFREVSIHYTSSNSIFI